jgi:hypothetical protein
MFKVFCALFEWYLAYNYKGTADIPIMLNIKGCPLT